MQTVWKMCLGCLTVFSLSRADYAEKRRSSSISRSFFPPRWKPPPPIYFLHPMLYFNLSFIYIHIEFVVCHMLADVVMGYGPGSSFPFSKAAEHIHLFYVLSDEIRRKKERLLLGRWANAWVTLSTVSFPVGHLQGANRFCLNIREQCPVLSVFSWHSS